MTDLLITLPPDDTGTDTIRRFRYQARLALPFCLDCATGGAIRSVIMEHYEDIVVEYNDHWRFIQVKTRDGSRGPWKLSDALDGLRSLHRAYQSAHSLNVKYSLFLEGAVAYGDLLNNLLSGSHSLDDDLCKRVGKALGIREQQCREFLALTLVQPNQPPRDHIQNWNVRLLATSNPNTSQPELEAIEKKLTDEIFAAMGQERLGTIIPAYIGNPDRLQDEIKRRVDGKRFTPAKLLPLLESLVTGPFPLLRRLADPNLPPPTNLEKKLIDGGATESIIRNAKTLRANAAIRELEFEASQTFDSDSRLDDAHQRIEILANSITAKFVGISNPARQIWGELQKALAERAKEVDPNMIYKRDPFLLLGAACERSDQCHIDWGRTDA